jgi:drug/metabolite transporter, DME family
MEKEHWYMILSGIFLGTIVFGGQLFINTGLSTYEISLFRLLPALFIMGTVVFLKKYKITKEMIPIFLIFGVIGPVGVLSQYGALAFGISVPVAVFLMYTQPIWTTIIGKMFFKENINKTKIIAVLLSLMGIFIIADPLNIETTGNIIGIILALIAGITISLWVACGKKAGIKKFDPALTLFIYVVATITFLLITQPIAHSILQDPTLTKLSFDISSDVWGLFALFSIVSYIIPHFLMYKGIKKLPIIDTGIILMLEPIAGSLLAFVFLTQPITLNIIAGGALILASNYLVISKKEKNQVGKST